MEAFEPYVGRLESLALSTLKGQLTPAAEMRLPAILDGEAARELRRFVPLTIRKEQGAFFTSAILRTRAMAPALSESIDGGFFDPACGAGDLLLGCTDCLPITQSLPETLQIWGEFLHGFDIEPLFIRATKARLILAAAARGARAISSTKAHLDELLPNIRCADTLATSCRLEGVRTVVMNPPFITLPAPSGCSWAGGGVSSAAIFLERILKEVVPGTRLIAILPDVLRTGSRYSAWRDLVLQTASVDDVDVYGTFDPQADVDVFVLRATVGTPEKNPNIRWLGSDAEARKTVGDVFKVSVGPVVPHRHKEEGPNLAYLTARNASAGSSIMRILEKRRFSGRKIIPPFVVVHRTSSPRDKHRAKAAVVLGKRPVAVENHLIVLEPRDGQTQSCFQALSVLRATEITTWLNQRMRCRHLTVAAVSEIPWLPEP